MSRADSRKLFAKKKCCENALCSDVTTESATDFEIDQILMHSARTESEASSWLETGSEDTAESEYEYYWSKSGTG